MKRTDSLYRSYCDILREELKPATGCTEPIAVAYCAAVAASLLPALPERVEVEVSGNIIKNVKSVIVPNTGGLKGIPAAAAAGIVAGDAKLELEVLSRVSEEEKAKILQYLKTVPISVAKMENADLLDIRVTVHAGENESSVRVSGGHTHIHSIRVNGKEQPCGEVCPEAEAAGTDRSCLTVEQICAFADILDIEDVRDILDPQIECNTRIAEEGIRGNWGAQVGKILLKTGGNSPRVRAKAMAAAGSDARMSGCEMPVVINSGSGNQGLTVSLPVIEYYNAMGLPKDRLYRALAVSNLCAIHAKSAIGKLSAYCGAVTAGSAAAAGIAYLKTGDFTTVAHTIVNSLAITSGIVCDGAKPSCAAKIASAIDAGLFGLEMYENGQQFYAGDGILSKGVEQNIVNVGILGRDGMRTTDDKILEIMLNEI